MQLTYNLHQLKQIVAIVWWQIWLIEPIFANLMPAPNQSNPGSSCKPMQTLFDTFYKFPSTWWHCTPKNWVQKFLTHLNVAEKVCDTFKGRAIKLIHTLQIFKTLCEENVWKRCKTCQVLGGSFEMLFLSGLTLVKADICLSQNCRLWSLCSSSSGVGLQTQCLTVYNVNNVNSVNSIKSVKTALISL